MVYFIVQHECCIEHRKVEQVPVNADLLEQDKILYKMLNVDMTHLDTKSFTVVNALVFKKISEVESRIFWI